MSRDVFEDLKVKVGCEYISDIQYSPNKEAARRYAGRFDLREYPLGQLSDLAEYLYATKERFDIYEQASAFFQRQE